MEQTHTDLPLRHEPLDAALLSRVEDACLNASAPPQQRWLDGWLLRLSPGKARRARSVHALAPGKVSLEARLAQSDVVYRECDLPLIFRITPFTHPAELDAELAQRGFVLVDETLVMVCPSLPGEAEPLPPDLVLEQPGHAAFADLVGALRGSSAEHRRSHCERLTLAPVPYQGWVLRRDDTVMACAQTAREGRFIGLYDVFVAPQARGRGLSRRLCSSLLAGARSSGAQLGYLQVQADNDPAIAVYRRLGFVEGYRYHYRGRPGQTS